MSAVCDARIADTPISVIDCETTGFTPGYDRMVELSIVRIEPHSEPQLVFDTLINPGRPVGATEIHGITNEDVANAPRFADVAGEVVEATRGSVIAAYNVYFDIKFLDSELSGAGIKIASPHFCLMYLRTMLGLGSRCRLNEACKAHGIPFDATHVAAHDAKASAILYLHYLQEINRLGVATFGELALLRKYKFNDSFAHPVMPSCTGLGLRRFDKLVSRAGFNVAIDPTRKAFGEYWEVLKSVLTDLSITDEEMASVRAERQRTSLTKEQIRVLHAKAFAGAISQFTDDQWLDDREVARLRKLRQCLEMLGWAPGH